MPASAGDFRQHLEVETPEHVVLDYEIAGIGSRAAAGLLDGLILVLSSGALGAILLLLNPESTWAIALVALISFAWLWGYFAFFEGLRQGQTPGKRAIGIRVVRDTGHPIGFGAAALRNLLRIADFLPPPYGLGMLLVALHPRGKRLGDLVAGTVVVRDRPFETPASAATPPAATADLGLPDLSPEEYGLLRGYAERAPQLAPSIRHRLAEQVSARLPPGACPPGVDPEQALTQLYEAQLARRRGPLGLSRVQQGRPADRLPAAKEPRWAEFEIWATRAAQRGLDDFQAEELPEFAARYRELAADLARARTYQADPNVTARLERLVAAGHNALYRDERTVFRRLWEVMVGECPAAALYARRMVLLAMAAFWIPALGGYLLLRDRPALAEEVLPDVILARAEAGAARIRRGQGYAEVEASVRPLVASTIITNNLRVAFNCFAGGVFLGVGSLVLLGYNGLSLGAVAGHFANRGLLWYLLSFILGHGLLELTAVWLSGAAGFLLGRALLFPGEVTRTEAIMLAGRVAVRLVGMAVVLLLLAGAIEGFVSTSEEGPGYRIAVSGASLVFLALYLLNGSRYLARFTAGMPRLVPARPLQSAGLGVAPAAAGWAPPRAR
jgi:uncharacterized membrane protein SpoIIM required for sporulation/uncharacterized RDD family membrane protein YckC